MEPRQPYKQTLPLTNLPLTSPAASRHWSAPGAHALKHGTRTGLMATVRGRNAAGSPPAPDYSNRKI